MSTIFRRSYAIQSVSSKKSTAATADKRYTLLKQVLYSDQKRTPTSYTKDQQDQHTLVERMWCLEKQREKDAQNALLDAQFVGMRKAALALEKMDMRLFMEATRVMEYTQGETIHTFPLKLRVPTNTPSKSDYSE